MLHLRVFAASPAGAAVELPIPPASQRPLRDARDLPCILGLTEAKLVGPAGVVEVFALPLEVASEPQNQVVTSPRHAILILRQQQVREAVMLCQGVERISPALNELGAAHGAGLFAARGGVVDEHLGCETILHDRPISLIESEEEAAEDVVDGDVIESIQGFHTD